MELGRLSGITVCRHTDTETLLLIIRKSRGFWGAQQSSLLHHRWLPERQDLTRSHRWYLLRRSYIVHPETFSFWHIIPHLCRNLTNSKGKSHTTAPALSQTLSHPCFTRKLSGGCTQSCHLCTWAPEQRLSQRSAEWKIPGPATERKKHPHAAWITTARSNPFSFHALQQTPEGLV